MLGFCAPFFDSNTLSIRFAVPPPPLSKLHKKTNLITSVRLL